MNVGLPQHNCKLLLKPEEHKWKPKIWIVQSFRTSFYPWKHATPTTTLYHQLLLIRTAASYDGGQTTNAMGLLAWLCATLLRICSQPSWRYKSNRAEQRFSNCGTGTACGTREACQGYHKSSFIIHIYSTNKKWALKNPVSQNIKNELKIVGCKTHITQ